MVTLEVGHVICTCIEMMMMMCVWDCEHEHRNTQEGVGFRVSCDVLPRLLCSRLDVNRSLSFRLPGDQLGLQKRVVWTSGWFLLCQQFWCYSTRMMMSSKCVLFTVSLYQRATTGKQLLCSKRKEGKQHSLQQSNWPDSENLPQLNIARRCICDSCPPPSRPLKPLS